MTIKEKTVWTNFYKSWELFTLHKNNKCKHPKSGLLTCLNLILQTQGICKLFYTDTNYTVILRNKQEMTSFVIGKTQGHQGNQLYWFKLSLTWSSLMWGLCRWSKTNVSLQYSALFFKDTFFPQRHILQSW